MPAQAGDGLAEVYRVARILDLLFRDIRNEGCGFSKDFEDTACHAQFGALTLSPEQIDRPGLSLDESGDHSPAMIVDMDPVTDLCSLASDVNRLLIKGGLDKGRHQLFRVLAGPVVAAGTGDDDILSVGAGPARQKRSAEALEAVYGVEGLSGLISTARLGADTCP